MIDHQRRLAVKARRNLLLAVGEEVGRLHLCEVAAVCNCDELVARGRAEQRRGALNWLASPGMGDASVRIAMPPGAEAFRAGDVYSHGGLSPQECVTPDIMLGGSGANPGAAAAKIVCALWRHRLPPGHTREVDPRDRHPE